jgi:DNA-binding NtrC family response regulator
VRIRVEAGTHGARRFDVMLPRGGELVLGSSGEADVRVDDPTVSGRHCRVTHTGDAVAITDLGARNGVWVGGVRVSRAALPIGGACEIGCSTVRIHAGDTGCDRDLDAPPLPGLVGSSPAMRALAASARRVAELRLPVLVRGESGTGKDLVARAIHDESSRAPRPFVAINAATISRELAESELFGHHRGAFTGAVRDRRGAFREAHGGTLFLDEIGAVPLEVQAKLLRVVEEGVVRPLGAETGAPVDVRLVAATCEPLEVMVADRRFRGDLYERLAVCIVQVPALRDRAEDIPALARYLLAASELGERAVHRDALAVLRAHRWSGNVRELRNVMVQAAVRARRGPIHAEHVAAVLTARESAPRRLLPAEALRIFEEVGRNVSAAARRADVPRSTMRDLLRAAGVAAWPRRQG